MGFLSVRGWIQLRVISGDADDVGDDDDGDLIDLGSYGQDKSTCDRCRRLSYTNATVTFAKPLGTKPVCAQKGFPKVRVEL